LVINHRQPKSLEPDDLQGLQLMANQAAIAIEKARLHREELKAKAFEKELEIGRQIQLSLLPAAPPAVPGWEFAAHYRSAQEVGGDFYDCIALPGGDLNLGLTIADVTGKGIPAALFMSRAHTMIRTAALSGLGPAKVLEQSNTLLCADRRAEMLVTAFYGVLETRSGRLTYANAGHFRPLWLAAGESACRDLPSHGLLLGAIPGIQMAEFHVDLAPGDLLVFYTDGVTEAMAADRSFFGETRLKQVVAAHAASSAEAVAGAIIDAVEAFAGEASLPDDLTLLVVRRLPGG
jgi:sigma-B regulation protein RsbU (phosphoserine phosphatase)